MMQAQIIVDRFLRKEHSYPFMLNAYERLLLVMLASYAGNKIDCFPSHQSLSRDCGMSTDSVKRNLKSLENKYLVKILRSTGSNNHYELTIPSADSTEGSQHSLPTQCHQHRHPVLIALLITSVITSSNIHHLPTKNHRLKLQKRLFLK